MGFSNGRCHRSRSSENRTKPYFACGFGRPFQDEFEFIDDVLGPIHVNRIERDVIDTPEFQRLFRLGQLGFVDLVYPSANHTRGVHSIGACFWAKHLIEKLNANRSKYERGRPGLQMVPRITRAEQVLISLGALLHDVPHGPFSHDIEKKTHYIYPDGSPSSKRKVKSHYGPYDKHDDFKANPALYVFLMDQQSSVLARVLSSYSAAFADLLLSEDAPHTRDFTHQIATEWPNFATELLPNLLFHLLVYEKPEEAVDCSLTLRKSFDQDQRSQWGLGPYEFWETLHRSWYQPFRHDIIGDTLSADLIDYLKRDQVRLGIHNELDLKLLNFYVLVPVKLRFGAADREPDSVPSTKYRCAIDLNDHKRGTFRAERLNDIFRLLDLRHQIHEKAVYHRVVQSAIAMLSRTGLMLRGNMPSLRQLYGFDGTTPALAGDDRFLHHLVEVSAQMGSAHTHSSLKAGVDLRQSLPCKLSERRVYRPLMVIPGDRIRLLLKGICDFGGGSEHPLREIAAIVDSPYFSRFFLLVSSLIEKLLQHAIDSEADLNALVGDIVIDEGRLERVSAMIPKRVIFWTTPYKQLYKDPAILVCANESVTTTIEQLQTEASLSDALRGRVKAGIEDAERKNEGLWKLYVFISDGLFYVGALARLIKDHPCALSAENHAVHLRMAQDVVVRALRVAWQYWQAEGKAIKLEDSITIDRLSALLQNFMHDSSWSGHMESEITQGVSAVNVSQYSHGHRSVKCRDVRYKFDRDRSYADVLNDVIRDPSLRSLVADALMALGVPPNAANGEELAEVAFRFGQAPEIARQLLVRAGAPGECKELLQSIWLGEFGLPQGSVPDLFEAETSANGTDRVRLEISSTDGSEHRQAFAAACRLVIKTDFAKHQGTLIEWYDEHVHPLGEEKAARFVAELRRSSQNTPSGRRRRTGDQLKKLMLFLDNLLRKHRS